MNARCAFITAPAIRLKTVSDTAALRALHAPWNALLRAYPERNVFLTHAWFCHWWETFGRGKALHVLLAYDGGTLVGIVPLVFYRERMRGLPVIVLGTFFNVHVSRTDFIIAPGYRSAVVARLVEHVAEMEERWDVVMLRQLPAQEPLCAEFTDACEAARLRPFAPQPAIGKCYLPLEGSWKDYLGRRTRHFRARIREQRQRLGRLGAYTWRLSTDTPRDFADMQALQARSWKSAGEAALTPDDWRFQQSVASAHTDGIGCENFFLDVGGRVVAATHLITYGGVMYAFQTMYDESARDAYAGRAMFGELLERTWERGEFTCFDFNGNSPFCRSWADQQRQYVDIQVYSRRPYSRALTQLKRLSRWMK